MVFIVPERQYSIIQRECLAVRNLEIAHVLCNLEIAQIPRLHGTLPDEVQDQLSGSTIFSTLDLQSGYWQLPVNTTDQENTAFSPGPGMGLYKFRRMPFGLTGAPSSFQSLTDKIFRVLSFFTTYVDEILVHSADEEHSHHFREVFQHLADAGLTLRGKKCHIGMIISGTYILQFRDGT